MAKKDYYERNRERLLAAARARYQADREANAARVRERYRTDPEARARQREASRKYYHTHRAEILERALVETAHEPSISARIRAIADSLMR